MSQYTHTSSSSYASLKEKLRQFIRQYYLQRWVRGILLFCLSIGIFYLVSTTLEYNLYLHSTIRAILFFSFIFAVGILGLWWVILPLWTYLNYQSGISNKEAAQIIGKHFVDVQDKLLNVLNLEEMRHQTASDELILASIDQKTEKIGVIPFADAIDWSVNKKLIRYLCIPILMLVGLYFFWPDLIYQGTERIVRYQTKFSPKAPFQFLMRTKTSQLPQYSDLNISAQLAGKALPDHLNIVYNGVSYPMIKNQEGEYSYTIKQLDKSSFFRLESAGFYSDEYRIDVVPKPMIDNFEIDIIPPTYTGQSASNQKNQGDISAPEGSLVIWRFDTKHVDILIIQANGQKYAANKYSNAFGIKKILKSISQYTVLTSNSLSPILDSQGYSVSLVRDANPSIAVNEFKDSLEDILYYAGDASDDYGVTNVYIVILSSKQIKKVRIPVTSARTVSFQFSTRELFRQYPKGADISYHFEVWDNDAINGSKVSRTASYTYHKQSEAQLQKNLERQSSAIQSDLQQSIKEAKQVQKDLEALKKKLLEKPILDYNDKKQLEELIKKQQEMQEKIQDLQKEIQRQFDKKNELKPQEKEIQDQQKLLNEIVDQMKNPEYEKLLEKIEQLMQKADKKEMMQNLQQMDQKTEKSEKNMERLMQLYKNLDYKQRVNDMIDQLDKLGKEQEKTALETELNKNTEAKQEALNKETKEAKQKLEELKKLNDELHKADKKEYEEISKDIEQAMDKQEEAEKELEKNDLEKGAEKQREAKTKLNDAKEKMSKLKKKQKKDRKLEDAKTIRRILQNIIYLSFEQEKLVNLTRKLSVQAPSYPKTFQTQNKLYEDFKMVEDSLYKVAARQPKIKKYIFEEIDKINQHSERAASYLVERQPNMAIPQEQYAMTAYNALGLLLSEMLKNMEEDEDEKDGPESDQMCDDPKKSKKKKSSKISLEKLGEMQSQLNQQMEEMQKKMQEKSGQNQDKPGEKKDGNGPPKQGQGKSGGSSGNQGQDGTNAKEIARIAAQQQAIRNALQKIENEKNNPDKSGKKPLGNALQDIMDKMKETEKDLVNRKFYGETLKRQKEIQVKLLESAKADREQDQEERRESEKAKNTPPPLPADLKKYLEDKKQNESQLQRTPVGLTPYFKSLTEKYFQLIK